MSFLTRLQQHWRAFRDDAPGRRFEHQYERMRRESPGITAAAVGLGALTVVGGVVLLFVPGPGMLLVVFGLGLVASVSRPLARLLDRGEPLVRRALRWARAGWQSASLGRKIVASVALVVLGSASALGLFYAYLS